MTTTLLPAAVTGGFDGVALLRPVGEGEVLHRLVDPVQLTAWDRQVARHRRPPRQQHRLHLAQEPGGLDVRADLDASPQHDPFGAQLRQAPLEDPFLQLELGDAVAQQAAHAVGPLVNRDLVAGAAQLLRGRQPGRAGADHGDLLPGQRRRGPGDDPALRPGHLDDLLLEHGVDDWLAADSEHAGRLAGRRAEAPGELGEVVGGVQALRGVLPAALVGEVVPFRDEVAEGAGAVAVGDPAEHAARSLGGSLLAGEGLVDFPPVPHAGGHRPVGRAVAALGEESRSGHPSSGPPGGRCCRLPVGWHVSRIPAGQPRQVGPIVTSDPEHSQGLP